MTDDVPQPGWQTVAHGYLLWAVHVAAQNEPDPATRNHIIENLLLRIMAGWDK